MYLAGATAVISFFIYIGKKSPEYKQPMVHCWSEVAILHASLFTDAEAVSVRFQARMAVR